MGIVLADHNDLGFRDFSPNDTGGFCAIHSRHRHIHQNDIRAQGFRLLNRVEPIHRLTANQPLARDDKSERRPRRTASWSSTIRMRTGCNRGPPVQANGLPCLPHMLRAHDKKVHTGFFVKHMEYYRMECTVRGSRACGMSTESWRLQRTGTAQTVLLAERNRHHCVCARHPRGGSELSEKGPGKSMPTILIVLLVLLLIGALPSWPYSSNWGYYPSGGLGLVLLIVVVLLLIGRL
jgi:hypothetical protein